MSFRLGVDVGGTFTDLLLVDESSGHTYMAKVLSTARLKLNVPFMVVVPTLALPKSTVTVWPAAIVISLQEPGTVPSVQVFVSDQTPVWALVMAAQSLPLRRM